MKLAAIFSNNMVLQQGAALPVWGTAAPGTGIGCRLAKVSSHTVADENGNWRLTLPAQPSGGPYHMTVRSAAETLELTEVYLGEVWLAGGQSNMELELQNSENGTDELAHCTNPQLHFYATPKVAAPGEELNCAEAQSGWQFVTPQTAATMSAVAYYAAKTLARHLPGVHIGIVECYWGGTFAHCWLPRAVLLTTPEGTRRIQEYEARIGGKTQAQYQAEVSAYNHCVQQWNDNVTAQRAAVPTISWPELNKRVGPFPWPPPAGKTAYQRPGNLYESMLARICPYAVRGVWYYQGEQDEDCPQDYHAMLTLLVRTWRSLWKQPELPFLLVQLPMYLGAGNRDCDPLRWPVLRAAQAAVAAEQPAVELVVLTDCGEFDNVHPVDKRTPGTRLGRLALQAVYGLPVQGKAPRCCAAHFGGQTVTLRFTHTGGELQLRNEGRGFEMAGTDGVFYPAGAVVQGDCVTLYCPQVSAPQQARYAWFSYGPAELFGATGLPAAPCWEKRQETNPYTYTG